MSTYTGNNHLFETFVGHLNNLRTQAGLTNLGLSAALDVTTRHVASIQNGKTLASFSMMLKTANFFELSFPLVVAEEPIVLNEPKAIPTVARFYKDNEENVAYFADRIREYSVVAFVREVLLIDGILKSEKTVGDLIKYSKETYNRKLTSQELAQELRRFYLRGELNRKAKFESGAVYLYSINKNYVPPQ